MLRFLAIDISWGLVTGVFAALGAVGVCISVIAFKGYQKWVSLSDTNTKEAIAKREKLAKEESELRETLLGRYKGLYELTRDESERNLKVIQSRVTSLTQELVDSDFRCKEFKIECDRLRDENQRLIALNLNFQTTQKGRP